MENQNNNSLPKLFSKQAIILLTLLFTPLFGGLVYATNLREVGNRKAVAPTILSMLILNAILFTKVLPTLKGMPLPISWIALNVIGAIILVMPFWEHQIKNETKYLPEKIWSPLLAGLFLYGGALGLMFALDYFGVKPN